MISLIQIGKNSAPVSKEEQLLTWHTLSLLAPIEVSKSQQL